ncbi:MAG: hypothetical protein JKY61_11945 [Planctomycetes bacterium]|nr:hypothetical protein [Planctomycetota bacterium]
MQISNSSHQRTGRSALPWLSVLLAVVLFAVLPLLRRGNEEQASMRGADVDMPQPLTDDAKIRDLVPFPVRADEELSEPLVTTVRTIADVPMSVSDTRLVRVTLLDSTDGNPAQGIAWWVIETGELDRGRTYSMAVEVPNPKPMFSGVTGDDGVAKFVAPAEGLVHLFTERTGIHARGSWPVTVESDLDTELRVILPAGAQVFGRVVDDEHQPIAGVRIHSRRFDNRMDVLGMTDERGQYRILSIADFPRGFVTTEEGEVRPGRIDTTSLMFGVPFALPNGSPRFKTLAKRIVLVETAQELEVEQVVIDRVTTIVGRVSYAGGAPAAGALVSVEYARSQRASGQHQYKKVEPLPWDPGGVKKAGDCFAEEDGTFRLVVDKRLSSSQRISAFAREGGSMLGPSFDLKPGEVSDPVALEIPNACAYRLQLLDADEASRAIRLYDPANARLLL